jgi:hypothetical protein
MDAKRLVPILSVREGRVVDPATGAALGTPSLWARRLEWEGADELLFLASEGKQDWITAVARNVAIPFTVEAPLEPAALLALGADRVMLPAEGLGSLGGPVLGRNRVLAAADASLPLEVLEEAVRNGAGEFLLRASGQTPAWIGDRCARLPLSCLLRSTDPLSDADALAHGLDGIAYPAALGAPSLLKKGLGASGVPLRS